MSRRPLDGQQIVAILMVFSILMWASVVVALRYMETDERAEENRPVEVEGR